ncbi:quercetin 2,3-dioxygenase [Haloferula helveola]
MSVLEKSWQDRRMKTNTSLTIRRSSERGRANHGWLDSHHTFSFADYYDPAHMGFRSLRVINEDRVAPLGGFPTHPHRDMEIFSYVVDGQLAHRDSMGNQRTLSPGEIQLMSAGSGVTHSEYNPSSDQPAHFLQIWITPRERGLEPSYTEWTPGAATERDGLVLLISPDGREGSAVIHQDADVHRLVLAPETTADFELRPGRGLWIQVVKGQLKVADTTLSPGDAASTEDAGRIEFTADDETVEALLFDLG